MNFAPSQRQLQPSITTQVPREDMYKTYLIYLEYLPREKLFEAVGEKNFMVLISQKVPVETVKNIKHTKIQVLCLYLKVTKTPVPGPGQNAGTKKGFVLACYMFLGNSTILYCTFLLMSSCSTSNTGFPISDLYSCLSSHSRHRRACIYTYVPTVHGNNP